MLNKYKCSNNFLYRFIFGSSPFKCCIRMNNSYKLTLDERAEVKMAFRNLDPDKTDVITKSEFKLALHTMFFDPTDKEIDEWMSIYCPISLFCKRSKLSDK